MLGKEEAKDVLMGKDVLARPRDIQEVINYRRVVEYIDEEAKRHIEKITEQHIKKMHRIIANKLLPDEQSGEYRKRQVVIKTAD